MANDTQVIREQMEQTRASLTEKLDTLEHQVVDTVQEATEAVAETVENVQDAVQETVATVKDSVQETVTSVKEAFDLERHVDRHPWGMFGGAIALGYLSTRLLTPVNRRRPSAAGIRPSIPPNGSVSGPRATRYLPPPGVDSAEPVEMREPGLLHQLADRFAPELEHLKALAVGTTMGLLRDTITHSMTEEMSRNVADIMDSMTVKLGGKPLQGPIFDGSAATVPTSMTG